MFVARSRTFCRSVFTPQTKFFTKRKRLLLLLIREFWFETENSCIWKKTAKSQYLTRFRFNHKRHVLLLSHATSRRSLIKRSIQQKKAQWSQLVTGDHKVADESWKNRVIPSPPQCPLVFHARVQHFSLAQPLQLLWQANGWDKVFSTGLPELLVLGG